MNWSLNEIRKIFLDYFITKKHYHCKSSSLIPKSDSSLLFTNSGMVQFKNIFLGNETSKHQKVVSVQKCLRAGGKHNDLEQVGYTKRHLTFFEMLGNFSFGSYFKEEAIFYAWEFITKFLCLNPQKIYITVYHNDEESYRIWKKITDFSDNKIIKINSDDNFWRMSEVGPCGPCSEIFFDRGEKFYGGPPGSAHQDGDRFLEIWNLVFMQFNQISSSKLSELSMKSVDTGMGLERIASILQSADSNFEIDVFQKIIAYIEDIVHVKQNAQNLFSYRILADHIRSASFLIAENLLPSNESSGYVLRRILRRAIRHIHKITNTEEPILYNVSHIVVELFREIYPELEDNKDKISNVIRSEEEIFIKTLNNGLKILTNFLHESHDSIFSGKNAFILYDTYGFPVDLTKEIVSHKGFTLDEAEFDEYMNYRKTLSRKSWIGSGLYDEMNVWSKIYQEFGASKFIGYDKTESCSRILAILFEGKRVEKISFSKLGKNQFILLLDKTVFYAESGGQRGDIGHIIYNNKKIQIIDTKKYAEELHAHICVVEDQSEDFINMSLNIGDAISLFVSKEYRDKLKVNHTATHLLNFALRTLIDKNVIQKGSYITDSYFRFDFNHSTGLSLDQICSLESFVNDQIAQNLPITTKILQKDIALQMGALGVFGEKYKDMVRVVSIGSSSNPDEYSIELCGGTHVTYTGKIGLFKIISEKSISSGIRRIECKTGQGALAFIHKKESILINMIQMLKTDIYNVEDKLQLLIKDHKDIQYENKNLLSKFVEFDDDFILQNIIQLPKIRIFAQEFNNISPKILLNSIQKKLIKKYQDLLVCYITTYESKYYLILAVHKDQTPNCDLSNIFQYLSQNFKFIKYWGPSNFKQIILNEKISLPKFVEILKSF